MIAAEPEPDYAIRFEGTGQGASEIWGGLQAYFIIVRAGRNAKEVALLVNDPAIEHIAEQLGVAESPEFRLHVADVLGTIVLRRLLDDGKRIDPAVTISRAFLEQNPDVLEEARRLLTLPQAG